MGTEDPSVTEAVRSHPTHLLVCALCLALGPWLTLATPAVAQAVDVFITVPHDSGPAGPGGPTGPTDPGAPPPPEAPTTPPARPDTPDAPSASPVEPLPRTGASARDLAVIAAALVALGTAVLTSTNSRKRVAHA